MCLVSNFTFCGFNLYGGSYAFARGSFSKMYLLTGVALLLLPLFTVCLLRFPSGAGGCKSPLSGVNDKLSMSLPALSRKARIRLVFGFSEAL